ncbi:Peptidase family M23 [Nitrosospira sp. Nl5]|uniref:M23 family metallopeptidase n=1 Tax=Nitrosospira sp. Nl5 TaxID=200120 RepID=UPI00088BC4E2|nr:M23 family metallopeptidase [Nitrosospira sp. Nl5]SCY18438.1 Peptidase family M23 [Nitrosospira sp. Nl5]
MNVILISNNLAKARTLTLTSAHLVLLAGGFLLAIVLLAMGLNYLSLRYADKIDSPSLRSLVLSVQQEEHQKTQSYLRDSLNAMAVRMGQMQAQLLRLDSVGARLAELSGIKPQEFLFNQSPGQGGILSTLPSEDISFVEFNNKIQELSLILDDRADKLGALDSVLMQDRLKKKMLPSIMPVSTKWYSSGFGVRIDPFTGRSAFHEGVDFTAATGTPIVAAAGGVVVYSGYHPEYGNMIDVDHGNDLVSRYAHASKRLVTQGQVVVRGQKIAEVGSTGRSTGPHLHFEVRHRGLPQNPSRFLKMPG